MGNGNFTSTDWDAYSSTVRSKPKAQVFTQTTIKSTNDPRTSFDPKTLVARESRDSDDHPEATPIIFAFDVTGSMGDIPHYFVQEGLGKLMEEVFDRKPVSDPHIMCMAVGDGYTDHFPLQTTQFEADIRIAKQLQELYLEGNGGGNEGESYLLAWYFAATKTSTDAYEKRGKKGVLFTIGDEPPHLTLTKDQGEKILGVKLERDLSASDILEMARRQYDVYHIVIEQGSGLRQYGEAAVIGGWNKLLGEGHVLRLSDYTKLSEVVTSVLQVNAGADPAAVSKTWSGDTSLVVAKALKNTLPTARRSGGQIKGPVALFAPQAA
jgi:hypothetical protein